MPCKKRGRRPVEELSPPPTRPTKSYLLEVVGGIDSREKMYNAGTIILAFEPDAIPLSLRKFQAAYDLWLALGNGYRGIFSGDSYLSDLIEGVAAFRDMGATYAAAAGDEVIAAFRHAGVTGAGDEMVQQYYSLEEQRQDEMLRDIEAVDSRYIHHIWQDTYESIEQCLLSSLPAVIENIRRLP